MIAETTDGSDCGHVLTGGTRRTGISDAATVGRRRKCSIPATPLVVHQALNSRSCPWRLT